MDQRQTITITVCIQPRTAPQRAATVALKHDLEFIARKTVGAGITELTRLMWNSLREKCANGLTPFVAIDQTTEEFAAQFIEQVTQSLPKR